MWQKAIVFDIDDLDPNLENWKSFKVTEKIDFT